MRRKQRVEHLISAGGVVYRAENGEVQVVVCGLEDPPINGLPKGTPEPGESREQTAAREVTEETGLQVQIEGFIGSIEYWFVWGSDPTRYHKTVFFYLMSTTGGDLSQHDHEFDFVSWMPASEALQKLTYENEVKIVEKGLSMASKIAPAE